MTEAVVAYAAYDVHISRLLLLQFRACDVAVDLLEAVSSLHSERYCGHLRDRVLEAKWPADRLYIMEEIPIVKPTVISSIRRETYTYLMHLV
jgi:hypothetical protein